jgi:hypothetical protein
MKYNYLGTPTMRKLSFLFGQKFRILPLTEEQEIHAYTIALKIIDRGDRRNKHIILRDTLIGFQAQYSFIDFLTANGHTVQSPTEWWHDFIWNGYFFDHKAKVSGSTYSQTENENLFCQQNPSIEIFYACSDLTEEAGFGIFKGIISSKNSAWLPGNSDKSRFVRDSIFK